MELNNIQTNDGNSFEERFEQLSRQNQQQNMKGLKSSWRPWIKGSQLWWKHLKNQEYETYEDVFQGKTSRF